MRFDSSEMERAFDKMKRDTTKQGVPVVVKQGYAFRNIARKIGRALRPDPMEILNLMYTLKGRLKRAPGVTVPQEIGRRILKIGTYDKNWIVDPKRIVVEKYKIIITIFNRANYSGSVDDKRNDSEKAANLVKTSFGKALQKLAKKLTGNFNKTN
jgi:hypothetical protein